MSYCPAEGEIQVFYDIESETLHWKIGIEINMKTLKKL